MGVTDVTGPWGGDVLLHLRLQLRNGRHGGRCGVRRQRDGSARAARLKRSGNIDSCWRIGIGRRALWRGLVEVDVRRTGPGVVLGHLMRMLLCAGRMLMIAMLTWRQGRRM